VSEKRPRLAFVGPLPPVRSGIADYACDLLPCLESAFALELFVDDAHPLARHGRYRSFPVHPGRELPSRFADFDHVVYQMGNNAHHWFVLDLARRFPGIVVLHDLVLHHLYDDFVTREDEWTVYTSALHESYGAVGDAVVKWRRWRLASEREYFTLPLFESLVAASRGVLVHNRAAERSVRRRVPRAAVRRIPMGIPPEAPADPRQARRRLGIADDQVIVGAFGLITPQKRLESVAAALRRARLECPELRLVLIGEVGTGVRLEDIFPPEEFRSGRVIGHGYVGAEEYRDWMAGADIAVNLRYPTSGETSASLLRLLGDGKCTLVSAYRQFLEIPAEAAVRIPLGAEEEPTLFRELVALARDPGRRARIGGAARAFVAAEHSMAAAAAAFSRAVREIGSHPREAEPGSVHGWPPRRTSRVSAIEGSASAREAGAIRVSPGAVAAVELTVRNEGASEWISTPEPSGGHVGIAADLQSSTGERVARVRPSGLRRDLPPGAEELVRLSLRAPSEPGEYRLQPILVHFGRGGGRAVGRPIVLAVTVDGSA